MLLNDTSLIHFSFVEKDELYAIASSKPISLSDVMIYLPQYTVRVKCPCECSYSVHCTCTVPMFVHFDYILHEHRNTVTALTVWCTRARCSARCSFSVCYATDASKGAHTLNLLTVCAAHLQCTRKCTYSTYHMCDVHRWVHWHFTL